MAEPKRLALITADLHLDAYAWADRPLLCGDSQAAFQYICELARRLSKSPQSHEDFRLIAAGDLVERKKNESGPVAFINFMMNELETTGKKGVPFGFIQGQHDMQTIPWFSAVHHWPDHLHHDQACTKLGDRNMFGLDWTPPGRLQEALDSVPTDTDILVMHQVCDKFMGDITAPELSFDRIPHAKVLIVGDYHKHVKLTTRGAQGQKLLVLSPGSTHLREITEERNKRAFVLYDDLTAKSVKIPTREVIEPPDILMEESLEDLLEELDSLILAADASAREDGLPFDLLKPIIYVRYHRRLAGTETRLLRAIEKRAHLFTKPIGKVHEEEEEEELEASCRGQGLTLLGCLEEEVDGYKDPELFQGLQRLLSVDDPAMELTKMRKEHLDVEPTHAA